MVPLVRWRGQLSRNSCTVLPVKQPALFLKSSVNTPWDNSQIRTVLILLLAAVLLCKVSTLKLASSAMVLTRHVLLSSSHLKSLVIVLWENKISGRPWCTQRERWSLASLLSFPSQLFSLFLVWQLFIVWNIYHWGNHSEEHRHDAMIRLIKGLASCEGRMGEHIAYCKSEDSGNTLAVQWLGLRAFTTKGAGLIPVWGTKIPRAMQRGHSVQIQIQVLIIEPSILLYVDHNSDACRVKCFKSWQRNPWMVRPVRTNWSSIDSDEGYTHLQQRTGIPVSTTWSPFADWGLATGFLVSQPAFSEKNICLDVMH